MNLHPINSVLIANRGEIACRVITTARRLGIRSVAIYSEPDVNAKHVQLADSAVCVGGAQSVDSYLNIDRVLAAAKESGVQAIHPGYGFLSENADFVDACKAANIVFIGPTAKAIRAMGLKDAAKKLMESAGVPVVPGYHGDNNDADFLASEAERIGYPVLIKARAGGGGKGMRRVDSAHEFKTHLKSAQREALASFSDGAVLIEKYIETPRHIEVQVFGDTHDNIVHLFERDCSLQRRHQKVIEEAPAPGMSAKMRDAMTTAAIKAAKAVDYVGAGTVEFIVSAEKGLSPDAFWFMEMNTRLQVEHPVTEAVTGQDLVEWQFKVAQGQPLPLEQKDIQLQGHAVEARLYAEDPDNNFMPATGTLHRLRFSSAGRIDSGVNEGDEVLPFYDPMLAKFIAHQNERAAALNQLKSMLDDSVILGTLTNRSFLSDLCAHPSVQNEQLDTGLIERDALVSTNTANILAPELALAAIVSALHPEVADSKEASLNLLPKHSLSLQIGQWQLWGRPSVTVELSCQGQVLKLLVVRLQGEYLHSRDLQNGYANYSRWQVSMGQQQCQLAIPQQADLSSGAAIIVADKRHRACALMVNNEIYIQLDGDSLQVSKPRLQLASEALSAASVLLANMPGRVIALHCKEGDQVLPGQALVTLEAMKMEHSLSAKAPATVNSVKVQVGQQVAQGAELLGFELENRLGAAQE